MSPRTRKRMALVMTGVLVVAVGAWGLHRWESPAARASRLLARGTRALAARHYQEAIIDLRGLLRIRPHSAPGLHEVGIAYLKAGDAGAAAFALEKSLQIAPDDPEARVEFGTA